MSAARSGITRRSFLQVSGGALGGLLAQAWFGSMPLQARGRPQGAVLGAFVRLEPDGQMVIGARTTEIGQGVKTSLPMLIAEELDVSFERVRVEQLPYELVPADTEAGFRGKYGSQGAGGSTSIPGAWQELRQVGARVRQMLLQAGAQHFEVDVDALSTRDGTVRTADGRAVSYTVLAPVAATLPVPEGEVPLKVPQEWRVIGSAQRVVDAREIVTGAARYGIDSDAQDALVAIIARCPYFDGAVARVDDAAARAVPGVRDVVVIGGPQADAPIEGNLAAGVAVIADDTWSAIKGRDALEVTWRPGPWADDSTDALEARAGTALELQEGGLTARADGDVAAVQAQAERRVSARYTVPFLAHSTLEPQNALVHIDGDRARLVASLQSPAGASRMISRLTGIPRLNIDIELPRAGGGFGRRLQNDFVAEAVLVAQAVKQPIKLMWTREDDMRNDWYRPFGVQQLDATLDGKGVITSWQHRVAGTSRRYRAPGLDSLPEWVACLDPDGFPAGCVEHYHAQFHSVQFGLARGWWRGPLPTYAAFATQSFLDEVAHAAGSDPLALQLELLGEPRELPYRDHGGPVLHTGRLAAVLRRAGEAIGWGREVPDGHGLGIAGHFVFGGYAAHAMEVSVGEEGALTIHRCVAAIDVGTPVNPLGIEAQMQGGTIDGLSTALGLEITVRDGRIVQDNFPSYPLMAMGQSPRDVEVHIVATDFAPSGCGEMGIPTAAPALTNAIFAATGKRIRRLPVARQLRA